MLALGTFVQMFAYVSLFVFLAHTSAYREVPMKKYLSEKVCWDVYGTLFHNYYKIRDKRVCGTKCTENNECSSFIYHKKAGWCRINSGVFVNRTTVGCSYLVDYVEITTVQPLRHAKPPKHCGPVPYISSIIVNKTSGNYSIGSQFPYKCNPCTSFPPLGSPGVLTCGTDGTWIIPTALCVHGADIGLLRDGSPIPVDAVGCASSYSDTCKYGSIHNGLQFDGDVGYCYCDSTCCYNQDCCFDTSCFQSASHNWVEEHYIKPVYSFAYFCW